MEEKKYEFVEEVIREKPSFIRRMVFRLLSWIGLAVVFLAGVALVIFLLKDNVLEELFAEDEKNSHVTDEKINLELDDGEGEVSEEDIAAIEKTVNRSMVKISAENGINSELLCTGVVISKKSDIYILVPFDKISGKQNIVAEFCCDGTVAEAVLWNQDTQLGIAAMVVDRDDVKKETLDNLFCAVISDTDRIERGYGFIYEGNPFGQEILTYIGNIAGVRTVSEMYDLKCRSVYTDVMMAKVSDGFLFDYNSNLIGMVVERYSKDSENTISALALYDIYDIIESILNDTFVGYVGIKGESLDYEIRKYVGNDIPAGVYVVAVENNSPAYQCGIMAGDIITKINHMDVDDMEDIEDMVGGCRQGTVLQITLERNMGGKYKEITIDVTVGERN